jgi:hypothetical protein
MGAGAWQLDMSAVLAPEYAHAITSFRFIKKVPLLGRFEDAAAMCLFYFLLMRVPTPATSPARVFAWLPAGVCSREPRNLARTRSRHARARTRAYVARQRTAKARFEARLRQSRAHGGPGAVCVKSQAVSHIWQRSAFYAERSAAGAAKLDENAEGS